MEDNIQKTEVVENQPTTVTVDYDKINNYINKTVDNEVGKFMKTFLENNTRVPTENNPVNEVSQTERELREWRI